MNRHRSSRQRYLSFVKDYKERRLDEKAEGESNASDTGGKARGKRRANLREYLRWLRPHRWAAGRARG